MTLIVTHLNVLYTRERICVSDMIQIIHGWMDGLGPLERNPTRTKEKIVLMGLLF